MKRMIFASSNHAVGFHRRERFIDDTVQPRPDTRYGVYKVFGEAPGRLYADKHDLSVACLRIGTLIRLPGQSAERRLGRMMPANYPPKFKRCHKEWPRVCSKGRAE
jgi:uronate dehydrogenase